MAGRILFNQGGDRERGCEQSSRNHSRAGSERTGRSQCGVKRRGAQCCSEGQSWGVTCGGASWEGSGFKPLTVTTALQKLCMHVHMHTQAQTHVRAHTLKQQGKAFLSQLTEHWEGGGKAWHNCLFFPGLQRPREGGCTGWLEARAPQEIETSPLSTLPRQTLTTRLDNLLKECCPLGGQGLLVLGKLGEEGGRVGRKVASGEEIMLP